MWVQQLDGDHDMLSQLDAIAGLERWNVGDRADGAGAGTSAAAAANGSEQELDAQSKQWLSVRALRDALGNPQLYYRVRCRAAVALAETSQYRAGTQNLELIGNFFKHKYSDPSLKQNFLKANDFSDFPEYFVKKVQHTTERSTQHNRSTTQTTRRTPQHSRAERNSVFHVSVWFRVVCCCVVCQCIPVCVSVVLDPTRLTPPSLVKFILSLLHNNDNAGNPYSDTHYLADIIHALGNIRLSHDESRAPRNNNKHTQRAHPHTHTPSTHNKHMHTHTHTYTHAHTHSRMHTR